MGERLSDGEVGKHELVARVQYIARQIPEEKA